MSALMMMTGLLQATASVLLVADAIRVAVELLRWHGKIRFRAVTRMQAALSRQVGHKMSLEHAEGAMDEALLPALNAVLVAATSSQALGSLLIWLASLWFAILVVDISVVIDIATCIDTVLREGVSAQCTASVTTDPVLVFPSNAVNWLLALNGAFLFLMAVAVWRAILKVVAAATTRARSNMRTVASKTKQRAKVAVDAVAVRSTLLQIAARSRGIEISSAVAMAMAAANATPDARPAPAATSASPQPQAATSAAPPYASLPTGTEVQQQRVSLAAAVEPKASSPAPGIRPRRNSNSSGSILWGSVASSMPDSDESSVGGGTTSLSGNQAASANILQEAPAAGGDDAASAVTWTDTASVGVPQYKAATQQRSLQPETNSTSGDTEDSAAKTIIPVKHGRLHEAEKRYRKWFRATKRIRSQWWLFPLASVASTLPPIVRATSSGAVGGMGRVILLVLGLLGTLALGYLATGKAGLAKSLRFLGPALKDPRSKTPEGSAHGSSRVFGGSSSLVAPSQPVVIVDTPDLYEPSEKSKSRRPSKGNLRKTAPKVWVTDQDLVDALANQLTSDAPGGVIPQPVSAQPPFDSRVRKQSIRSDSTETGPRTQTADARGTFEPMQLDDDDGNSDVGIPAS